MDKIQRELRLLKVYALFSTILFSVLILVAAKGPGKKRFEEIDVERINVVEKDGKVRLTLSNQDRMPGGQMAGVDLKSREGNRRMSPDGAPGAGLLFFNDDGDECGGLLYGSKMVNGKPMANVNLTFDHYGQDEAIGLMHTDQGGVSRSGLEVWDQPSIPISAEFARQFEAIQHMKDGPQKSEALRSLSKKHAAEFGWTPRVFVGHMPEGNAAAVVLMDTKARPRIRMAVDASNTPSLQFLNESGKVTFSLPTSQSANDKQATP